MEGGREGKERDGWMEDHLTVKYARNRTPSVPERCSLAVFGNLAVFFFFKLTDWQQEPVWSPNNVGS